MHTKDEVYEVGYVKDGRIAVMHKVDTPSTEAFSALDPEPVELTVLARGAGIAPSQVRPGSRWVTTTHGWKPA